MEYTKNIRHRDHKGRGKVPNRDIIPVWCVFGPCLVPLWSLFDVEQYRNYLGTIKAQSGSDHPQFFIHRSFKKLQVPGPESSQAMALKLLLPCWCGAFVRSCMQATGDAGSPDWNMVY